MVMTLEEYQLSIHRHLDHIAAAAQTCIRHVDQMVARPDFETQAAADLKRCEVTLRRALIDVVRAKAAYRRKEIDA